jgi:hypothetical protein
MPRLTRKEERLLRRTANIVRMYIASMTVVAALMCVWAARTKYAAQRMGTGIPEIEPLATWGNIIGIYLPLFAVVGAYVWGTRPSAERDPAPNGFAMALFRDAFTMAVLTVMLLLPWMLYRWGETLEGVNTYVVWYQTVLTAVAGGAFAYYFNGRISSARPATSAAPKPATPRRPRKTEPAAEPVAEG